MDLVLIENRIVGPSVTKRLYCITLTFPISFNLSPKEQISFGINEYYIRGTIRTLIFEGKMQVAMLITPFKTLVKHSCTNFEGVPKCNVRVTSVVPSL